MIESRRKLLILPSNTNYRDPPGWVAHIALMDADFYYRYYTFDKYVGASAPYDTTSARRAYR